MTQVDKGRNLLRPHSELSRLIRDHRGRLRGGDILLQLLDPLRPCRVYLLEMIDLDRIGRQRGVDNQQADQTAPSSPSTSITNDVRPARLVSAAVDVVAAAAVPEASCEAGRGPAPSALCLGGPTVLIVRPGRPGPAGRIGLAGLTGLGGSTGPPGRSGRGRLPGRCGRLDSGTGATGVPAPEPAVRRRSPCPVLGGVITSVLICVRPSCVRSCGCRPRGNGPHGPAGSVGSR